MKKNLPLIIALTLPILMLIFVVGLVYMPAATHNPNYNFLYATGVDYYWPSQYTLKNNHLIKNSISPLNPLIHNNEQLYLYNVHTNQISQVDYANAKQLFLDPQPTSPDGFHIVHSSGDNSFFSLFFFSSPDFNTRFLQKNSFSKRLKLKLIGQFYNSFHFIGWIVDGKTNSAR